MRAETCKGCGSSTSTRQTGVMVATLVQLGLPV